MGNSASSSSGRGHHDDSVDYGHLSPQGVYTGPRDWNQAIVSQLICARRLAPFYRPLEEYEDSWDDDQILAARKELSDSEASESITRIEATASASALKSTHGKRPAMPRDPGKPEATVYRGAVECPICFLYYPPNINHSRCCDQAICTECFVQIKRSEPTTTHLVSEPAACPYCVQPDFGVVYIPPPWRAGVGSEGTTSIWSETPRGLQQSIETAIPYPTHKRRQKSFGADSPEVVTTDQIRPDWEAKLAAVRAAVTRRANRRIIMRQVGDRLIPVGVTSGRPQPNPDEAGGESADNGGSRRSRRRQQPANEGFAQYVGMGQDLEEIMLMEAMRLSLLDHEEHQRKEAEERRKQGAAEAESTPDAQSALEPGPSTLEPHTLNQGASSTNLSSSPSSSAPISSSPSPNPTRDSANAKRSSFSFSGSRSPSPSPGNTVSSLQSLHDPSPSWRRRTSSPPPFSTLSGALSAASAATAVLGHNSDESDSNPTTGVNGGGSELSDGAITTRGSIPTITIGNNDNITASQLSNGLAALTEPPDLSQPPTVSMMPSIELPAVSYEPLPSSPESVTHEPLLSRADSQGHELLAQKVVNSAGESQDLSEAGR